MVCGLSDFVSIYIYRGILGLQLFLAAIGMALIPMFFTTPLYVHVTWIEILFFAVCVITTLEAIVIGGIVLIRIAPNGKALIPRHRILFAIVIVGSGIALLIRGIMLSNEGVPECATTTDRKGHDGKLVEDQDPCQEFFKKCLVAAASLFNGVLYAATAFIDPIKFVYGSDPGGSYGNVGVVYNAPQ